MKVVYLDQNKWIDLAKVHYGKSTDTHLVRALEFAQSSSHQGAVMFPLSAVHYMETARIGNSQRRARLGNVMWELSRGFTMASLDSIVQYELELALSKRIPELIPRPFSMWSKGFAHAFGENHPGYRIPEPLRSTLPIERAQACEEAAQLAIEKAVITGEGPEGTTQMAQYTSNEYRLRFKNHLATLFGKISQLPSIQWEDALNAMELIDILEPINETLQRHGVRTATLLALDKQGLSALVQDLPSRRVDLHLHWQILRNPSLRPKPTDLEDWSGLGPAAAHCDVVVCEKHFANLLIRDSFSTHARVITDIRELPDAL